MPSLILEGGTFRPIFSAGVMDALLDNDIIFPYCIGVSAGITNGVSYISKQKGRNLAVIEQYRNDKRYLGLKNFFSCHSIFGLDFVFNEIPNNLLPFDMDTYQRYSGKILVGVTNAQTGQTEYLDGKDLDENCTILRATCAIPYFFPCIKYKGNEYSVPKKYINKTLKVKEIDNKLYVYDNTKLVVIHDISDKKINYLEEHYKEGLSSSIKYKSDEEIDKLVKENLELFDKLTN